MSDNPFRGRNPFDDMIDRRVPPSDTRTGHPQMDRIMARMEHAATQAERQRALAQQLRERRKQNKVAQTSTPPPTRSTWTGFQVWTAFCVGVWVLTSLVAMSENIIGGVFVSLVLFFLCVGAIWLPRMFSNIFNPTGRSNNGSAV